MSDTEDQCCGAICIIFIVILVIAWVYGSVVSPVISGCQIGHPLCNGTCFDAEKQTCCNNVVYRGKDLVCDCGGKVCSQGELCCHDYQKGGLCYDPSTHECKVVGHR